MKTCKACWVFWSALLGAEMMYCLHLAVSFRANPSAFHCPCIGTIISQTVISLVVVVLTFESIYLETREAEPKEVWQWYFKAFTQASLFELVINAIQYH